MQHLYCRVFEPAQSATDLRHGRRLLAGRSQITEFGDEVEPAFLSGLETGHSAVRGLGIGREIYKTIAEVELPKVSHRSRRRPGRRAREKLRHDPAFDGGPGLWRVAELCHEPQHRENVDRICHTCGMQATPNETPLPGSILEFPEGLDP